MAFFKSSPAPVPKARINHQITAPELRVIGEDGTNLGVMSKADALRLARPQDGIDLIEISAAAKPPVARLMNYDKFRYEEEKRIKKERIAQKGTAMKTVQISARAAENDLMVRVRQVEKFFKEGHPVEVTMRLRGREKRNKDFAMERLHAFLKLLPMEYRMLNQPRFLGNGPAVQIAKK